MFYFIVSGKFSINNLSIIQKFNSITYGIFFVGLGAGVVEEMIFRGIIFNSFAKKYDTKIAIIFPSLLFGIIHMSGKYNIFDNFLIIFAGTMVGVMFSLIAYESKSIWSSAIVHGLWNCIIIGNILNVGSTINEKAIWNYEIESKKFFITGGEFGIESSLIAVIGYSIVSLIVYFMIKKKNY